MMRSAPWLPLSILVLLVALTFWLDRLAHPDTARGSTAGRDDPDLIVENFSARNFGPDGAIRYTLAATRMAHHPAEDAARLEAVSFESISTDQPRIRATSATGQVSDDGDLVVLEGNVVVTAEASSNVAAWRLSTPKLTLLPEQDIARSNAGVRLESRDLNMTASAFEFNTKTRVLNLQDIKATYLKVKD